MLLFRALLRLVNLKSSCCQPPYQGSWPQLVKCMWKRPDPSELFWTCIQAKLSSSVVRFAQRHLPVEARIIGVPVARGEGPGQQEHAAANSLAARRRSMVLLAMKAQQLLLVPTQALQREGDPRTCHRISQLEELLALHGGDSGAHCSHRNSHQDSKRF